MAESAETPAAFVGHVAATIRRHAVFVPGEYVVVAVSGGPDSLCLLHCLHTLAPDLELRLHVAHVQHGLRGEDAEADAAFVQGAASALGLACSVLRVDLEPVRRAARGSLEDAARRARYTALRSLAREIGATCIATGHNEDDQAETLLLHLLRGSGIDGLSGMRPRHGDLARPLLERTRSQIEAYCAACRLPPRRDASNASRVHRRNQIRLDLLPQLERYNPRVREALARCARLLGHDAAYMHAQADQALEALLCEEPGVEMAERSLSLDRQGYRSLPEGLRLHVLRCALERVAGSTERFTADHLEAIDELACNGSAGRRWQLPRQVRVEAGVMLHIGRRAAGDDVAGSPLGEASLPVPGEVRFGRWILRTSRQCPAGDVATPWRGEASGRRVAWCDAAAIGSPLAVRARARGDRLRPLGLGGTKKVQDLLVDLKIARSQRDTLPLVVGPHGIVWVVGCALDEHARWRAGGAEAIRIEASYLGSETGRVVSG